MFHFTISEEYRSLYLRLAQMTSETGGPVSRATQKWCPQLSSFVLNTLTLNLRTVVVYILRYPLYGAIRHIGVFVLLGYSSYRGTRYTESTLYWAIRHTWVFVSTDGDVRYTGVFVICKGYFLAGII